MIHWSAVLLQAAWLPAAVLMLGLSYGWGPAAAVPAGWARRLLAGTGLLLLIGNVAVESVTLARMYLFNAPTFYVYRRAAEIGLQHGWDRIYDLSLYPIPLYFNPPPLAWLVATGSALPDAVEYTAWVALELILVTAAAVAAAPRRHVVACLYVAVALALVGRTFTLVESSLIVVAAVALAWRLLMSEREVAAGLVLSVLTIKPNLAVLVPFALLVAGRRRAFFSWAAVTAILVALSLVLLGSRGVTDYAASLGVYAATPGQRAAALEGVVGATPLAYQLHLMGAGLALLAALRCRREPVGIAIAAGLIGSALLSPTFHSYDWVAPLLAFFLIWISRPSRATAALTLAAVLLSYADVGHPALHEVLWIVLEAGCLGWLAWSIATRRLRPASLKWTPVPESTAVRSRT